MNPKKTVERCLLRALQKANESCLVFAFLVVGLINRQFRVNCG